MYSSDLDVTPNIFTKSLELEKLFVMPKASFLVPCMPPFYSLSHPTFAQVPSGSPFALNLSFPQRK